MCNLHASQMYVLLSIDRRSIAKAIMAFLTYRRSLFYIFIFAFLYVFYVIPAPISCPCFAFFRISYLRISVFLVPALEKDPMAAFFRISAKTCSKSLFNANRNRVLSVQSVRVRRMYFSTNKNTKEINCVNFTMFSLLNFNLKLERLFDDCQINWDKIVTHQYVNKTNSDKTVRISHL